MSEHELDYDQAHLLDPELHGYELHPRLAADTLPLGHFRLCDLLLMKDARYPWFVLVPRRPDIAEIYHLSLEDQQQLIRESSYLAENLRDGFNATRMNIASLGNQVPQLHLHHIVRYEDDRAWPRPVWGLFEPLAYSAEQVAEMRAKVAFLLARGEHFQPYEDIDPAGQ